MKTKKNIKETIKRGAIKVGEIGLVCTGLGLVYYKGVYDGALKCSKTIFELMNDSENPLKVLADGNEIDFSEFVDIFTEHIGK